MSSKDQEKMPKYLKMLFPLAKKLNDKIEKKEED